MRWPWQLRRRDEGSEVQGQLAKLDARDVEVAELRERLDEATRRNNFSGLVVAAIHRAAGQGR